MCVPKFVNELPDVANSNRANIMALMVTPQREGGNTRVSYGTRERPFEVAAIRFGELNQSLGVPQVRVFINSIFFKVDFINRFYGIPHRVVDIFGSICAVDVSVFIVGNWCTELKKFKSANWSLYIIVFCY